MEQIVQVLVQENIPYSFVTMPSKKIVIDLKQLSGDQIAMVRQNVTNNQLQEVESLVITA